MSYILIFYVIAALQAHGVFKQLIEIKTTDSIGSTTVAAGAGRHPAIRSRDRAPGAVDELAARRAIYCHNGS